MVLAGLQGPADSQAGHAPMAGHKQAVVWGDQGGASDAGDAFSPLPPRAAAMGPEFVGECHRAEGCVGLARIPQQGIHLGGAEVAGIERTTTSTATAQAPVSVRPLPLQTIPAQLRHSALT